MENKYIACLVMHAVGDTIGFKNGEWEFMKSLHKVYEFIDIGGINHVSLKDWKVSDDTVIHIKVAESLLEDYNSINTFCEILSKKLIKALQQFEREGLETRYPGITTIESIKKLRAGQRWDKTPYNFESGGSGASMRNPCIGLAYYGEENRSKLIQISIESSRITHNSAVGYLGGMTSALFTAFAIEGIDIKKWPHELVKLFYDGTIKKYIKSSNRDVDKYNEDVHVFINKWKHYIKDKFNDKGDVIKRRSNLNLFMRSKYYYDNFGYKVKKNGTINVFPGSGGDDSVIIAYDCLLDAGDSWEKLVIYGMLHIGDTDTTGCIAAAWWGILKGFKDIPKLTLEHLEYKDKLEKLGKDLYNKYGKK